DDGDSGRDEIIVAVGHGGLDGGTLLLAAAEAARRRPNWRWRLLVGEGSDHEIRQLLDGVSSNVIVETTRPDYRALLQRCRASLSRAGYNTVVDLYASGAPAVIVPATGSNGAQQEQLIRARALHQRGGIIVSESSDTDALLDALDRAIAIGRRTPLQCHGAQRSVERLAALVD
ncbi:glycosyltransferase, partial [Gammaproteobacteria bacterium]|nr:glycosyltransferase [Gammaproteobacteria bacterium]